MQYLGKSLRFLINLNMFYIQIKKTREMKKLKLFVLSFTLLMIPFLSSCIDNGSDDSSSKTYFSFARVVNYLGSPWLIADSGETLVPTSASLSTLASNGLQIESIDKAYIAYTLVDPNEVTAQASKDASDRRYNVVLTYVAPLDRKVASVTKGSANDSISTDPIVQLDLMTQTSQIYINKGYLMIAPSYYFKSKTHYFTMFNYTDQSFQAVSDPSKPDVLNLYLSHNDNSETNLSGYLSSNVGSTYPFLYFMSFNINSILNSLPTTKNKITINVDIVQEGSTTFNKVYSTEYDI